MSTAKMGDTVKVHYTGRLNDESVFDTSRERAPLEFTIGEGNLIAGFERGIIGMEIGETRTLKIPPEEGYGNRDDNLVTQINGLEAWILKQDKYQIEILANLDKVPEAGAFVVVTWPKPELASGFPARVFAIVP